VLAWHAVAGAGVSGSMVRDLMLEAVEIFTIPAAAADERRGRRSMSSRALAASTCSGRPSTRYGRRRVTMRPI
jgi:hypothetical protein